MRYDRRPFTCEAVISPSAIAMMRHGNMAGTASALLGTNQFVIAAVTTIVLGFIDNSSAMPMAIVIAGCGIAATGLNFLTLGSRLDVAPPVLAETHT